MDFFCEGLALLLLNGQGVTYQGTVLGLSLLERHGNVVDPPNDPVQFWKPGHRKLCAVISCLNQLKSPKNSAYRAQGTARNNMDGEINRCREHCQKQHKMASLSPRFSNFVLRIGLNLYPHRPVRLYTDLADHNKGHGHHRLGEPSGNS